MLDCPAGSTDGTDCVEIVREYDDRLNPTPYKDYPNPEAEDVQLTLDTGGNTVGKLGLNLTSNNVETLIDDYNFSGKDLAKATSSKNRLLYATTSLTEDLHISGLPEVSITLACDKTAANLSVWLVSLPWNEGNVKITDNIITRGWADPKNYKSITNEEDLEPGKFYTVTFKLQPDDQIIRKGQQIGLMIFSSDSEFTLHPKPGTKLSVNLNETSLTLPFVGGKEAFLKATN